MNRAGEKRDRAQKKDKQECKRDYFKGLDCRISCNYHLPEMMDLIGDSFQPQEGKKKGKK